MLGLVARYEKGELAFQELLERVQKAAEQSDLPAGRKKDAESHLRRAELSADIGAVKQAIEILFPP
jgi:hypothetical protein